jgi:hypothetical protein
MIFQRRNAHIFRRACGSALIRQYLPDKRPQQSPHHRADAIKLTGFLDESRTAFDMPAWGALAVADVITETDIITIYEPDKALLTGLSVPKPPVGLNMSGCSGGPCFLVKTVNGIVGWFPVGMIYRGPRKEEGVDAGEFSSFDQIRIRRLRFLKFDGTIDDQGGWLPC